MKSKHFSNLLYWKKKLKHIKKQIKGYVYENAALCDYIFETQMKQIRESFEIQNLMKKLKQFEPQHFKEVKEPIASPNHQQAKGIVQEAQTSQSVNVLKQKPAAKKRSNSEDTKSPILSSLTPAGIMKLRKAQQNKRKKVTQPIPTDSCGQPIFPIELGSFTLHSLGEISGSPGFHTTDVIFPIGYCSTRIYASTKNTKQECLYVCLIKEINGSPRFEISADNEPNMPIIGSSPDECHALLLQRVIPSRLAPKGIEFFGLTHPTVHYLIQSSPNARKCSQYVFTRFEVNKYTKEDMEMVSGDALDFKLNFKAYLNHIIKKEIKEEQTS